MNDLVVVVVVDNTSFYHHFSFHWFIVCSTSKNAQFEQTLFKYLIIIIKLLSSTLHLCENDWNEIKWENYLETQWFFSLSMCTVNRISDHSNCSVEFCIKIPLFEIVNRFVVISDYYYYYYCEHCDFHSNTWMKWNFRFVFNQTFYSQDQCQISKTLKSFWLNREKSTEKGESRKHITKVTF